MLIAMAGLPGTGKSTLAASVAKELGAVVLSKDQVRAMLFPPPALDHSSAQNDISMAAIFAAAAHILNTKPSQAVLLDGRTFLSAYQVRDLLALGAAVNESPRIIECICDDEVARARLEEDLAHGRHVAGNRTYDLYLAVKAAAEPIPVAHLTLDTGTLPLQECVRRSLAYLRGG